MNSVGDNVKLYRNVRLVDCTIQNDCLVADDSELYYTILDEHCEIGRRNLVMHSKFGYGSYTGANSVIKYANIGKFSCISSGVNIYGRALHDYSRTAIYTDYWLHKILGGGTTETLIDEEKTVIGNDVWIGTNATILNGIRIGDGAVIGAGTVVVKDVAPYSIVVGNPAQEIKKRYPQEYIDRLLKIKWWNFPIRTLKENESLLRATLTEDVLQILEKLSIENNK